MVQGFLAAYLSVTDFYVFRSEAELGMGYADIALEPLLARYPHLRVGYLIELKYLKRSEPLQRSEPGDQAGVATAVSDATAQLQRYLADERLARQFRGCGSLAWRWCSTAGRWCSAMRWSRGAVGRCAPVRRAPA